MSYPSYDLTFKTLRERNVKRCLMGFRQSLNDWSVLEWAGAAAGEMGEAANVAKKLKRLEASKACDAFVHGGSMRVDFTPPAPACSACGEPIFKHPVPNRIELKMMLGHEIADVIIYLDLLAASQGIDLDEVVREKFNIVSRRVNVDVTL